MDKLSVVLAVYNGMPYLPDAVESILNQTLSKVRLIVVDDGSTDGTAPYLNSLPDLRVGVVRQENRGLGASLNRGIVMCQTKYVARMDADDVSTPERLQAQLEYMEQHPEVVMLGTQVEFIAGSRRFRGPRKPLDHEEIRKELLAGKVSVCHPSCVFRTAAVREAGGYRIERGGEDADLFLRMCEVGRVANLDAVLHFMRIHQRSINCVAQEEVTRGRAYGIECARRREKGVPEPTFEEFCEDWERRVFLRRLLSRVDAWSAVQYRRALMDLGQFRSLRGGLRMACAAICRPGAVVRRITGLLRSRRPRH